MKHVVLLMWIALLGLAGCGGGGGGGSGGGSGGPGTLTVSTSSLVFVANDPSGPAPPPQVITGSVNGGVSGTLYILLVGSGPAIANISDVTIVDDTTGQALVSVPAPTSLGVGTYTGEIVVRACKNTSDCTSGQLAGSPRIISVTYHVAALQSSEATMAYAVTNQGTAAGPSRQTTITGIPAQNWTATDDAAWLTVSGSGSNGAVLTATLVDGAVAVLPNGTYTASVTVLPGTAGQPLVIPVSLAINRTQINYASPYVAYSGSGGEVIIRGEQFQQVAVAGVIFGSSPAESFTVVDGTTIRARYPSSLPVGRHRVRLQSSSTEVRELADLVIVEAPSFVATTLSYPNPVAETPNAIVYDAERAALAVSIWSGSGATRLVHFQSDGTNWQAPTVTTLFNNFGVALSGDGTEWIAGADKSVVHLRASDRAIIATVPSPLFGSGTQTLADFALANDGTIAMFGDSYFNCGATLLLYDVRRRTFREPGYTACRGAVGASGDGSRLIIPNQFPDFSSNDVYVLDTATGATTPTGIQLLTGTPPALDRAGSRIVLKKNLVYDGDYNYLGALAASTEAVALSPNGTRAYAYDNSGLLFTYDLTAAPVAGQFPTTGQGIVLAGNPGLAPILYGDALVTMTITPDGRTVFIAGSNGVVVQPVP